jgi:SAM-dependent methyltransferase
MPLDMIKIENAKLALTPSEIKALDLYISEAKFFYKVILSDIEVPPLNFYEIGSGIGLLSRLVAEKGHKVVATDPSSAGFNVIKKLHRVIEECFVTETESPQFYKIRAQELDTNLKENIFDYIFCANVVEHVLEQKKFFDSIIPKLKPSGIFRFICPNSLFPYEPHYGFISLPSKKLTYIIQRDKIKNSQINKSLEFYADLSFPNIFKLNRILNGYAVSVKYKNSATLSYLNRAIQDEHFAQRKKRLTNLGRFLSKPLLGFIEKSPLAILPIIDCYVTKNETT